MKKILNKISKLRKPYYILPIITLLFLTGFIGSYLFPNTVLDTYVINMTETEGDEELLLPLSATDPVIYEMNTGTLAMRGIQVGINSRDRLFRAQHLCIVCMQRVTVSAKTVMR